MISLFSSGIFVRFNILLHTASLQAVYDAIALSRARRQGPDAYTEVLAQLEQLSAAKVTALMAPGPVLLKLAATGFGVRLPGSSKTTE